MDLVIIAALDEGRVIGKGGGLPWRLPEDLRRFKRLTLGKPIIFGRATWASIGKPLPGRSNLILSQREGFEAPGCKVASSLDKALEMARAEGATEVTIGGGQRVYEEALPLASQLRLTLVHARTGGGDAFFPELDLSQWREVFRERHEADARHAFAWTWLDLVRA